MGRAPGIIDLRYCLYHYLIKLFFLPIMQVLKETAKYLEEKMILFSFTVLLFNGFYHTGYTQRNLFTPYSL